MVGVANLVNHVKTIASSSRPCHHARLDKQKPIRSTSPWFFVDKWQQTCYLLTINGTQRRPRCAASKKGRRHFALSAANPRSLTYCMTRPAPKAIPVSSLVERILENTGIFAPFSALKDRRGSLSPQGTTLEKSAACARKIRIYGAFHEAILQPRVRSDAWYGQSRSGAM